jgi:hypothetical protein
MQEEEEGSYKTKEGLTGLSARYCTIFVLMDGWTDLQGARSSSSNHQGH